MTVCNASNLLRSEMKEVLTLDRSSRCILRRVLWGGLACSWWTRNLNLWVLFAWFPLRLSFLRGTVEPLILGLEEPCLSTERFWALYVFKINAKTLKQFRGGTRATGATRCGTLGPSRLQRGGGQTGASGARTTLPTTGYDGASKHLGNAFATQPPCFKTRMTLLMPHLTLNHLF